MDLKPYFSILLTIDSLTFCFAENSSERLSSSWLDSKYWESGRQWGKGRVSVSTGDLGQGAIKSYNLYYGVN